MELNRRSIRIVLGVIAFAIGLLWVLWNFSAVMLAIRFLLRVFSFIIIGLSAAFVLNTPMRLIERGLALLPIFRKKNRSTRPAGVALTAAFLLLFLFLLIFMIIPALGRTIALLGEQIPAFVAGIGDALAQLAGEPGPLSPLIASIDWEKVNGALLNLFSGGMGDAVKATVGAATSIVSGAVNAVLGIVLGLYLLLQKEKLISQIKRVLYAFFPQRPADKLVDIARLTADTFSSFIGGQCFESLILFSLCFLGMWILGFPFAAMVSTLVGVTAFVPIFGALIGLIVGAFLILVNQGLLRALSFALFFFALQQIENNFIYPHIVGKSVMLSGLWVLIAVTLGGNLAGVFGMVVSVPICSVLYALLRELVDWRNTLRNTPEEKIRI